jgi:hypothetical protein
LYLFFFFQKKTLGDISFKLETKIMNFMTGFFFRKKYNQANSSVVNDMQYNLFTTIVRVNIEFFNGYKKIKKRRISFVLGYLRTI